MPPSAPATKFANPFTPAEKIEPKVKALLFGGAGIGKTYSALTAPGPIAVIDTEGGTALYAGRKGLSPFHVLPTKSYTKAKEAIEFLEANPGQFETLVIDPVTIIYEVLQDAALLRRVEINARRKRGATNVDEADLEQLDWGRIKRSYKALMTRLVNLPMHVLVTAREKAETKRNPQSGEFEQTGRFLPDSEKGTAYYFDVVLHLRPVGDDGREAVVTKDRTGSHDLGTRLADTTFSAMFAAVLKQKGKAQRHVQDAGEAAEADAAAESPTPSARAIALLVEWLEAAGKDPDQVLRELKKSSFADLTPAQVTRLTEKAKAAAGEAGSAPAQAPADPAPAEPDEAAEAAAEVA